jgi:hypothetical protein
MKLRIKIFGLSHQPKAIYDLQERLESILHLPSRQTPLCSVNTGPEEAKCQMIGVFSL